MVNLDYFLIELKKEDKSINTIKSYGLHVKQYINWFEKNYNKKFESLYRENIIEFTNYLKNIKKLNAHSINAKLSALIKFNEIIQQNKMVITKKDMIKIQENITSLTTVKKLDVEHLRQIILENEGVRNYAIVTVMAYAGLRISETLNIKLNDYNLISRELRVTNGKGSKQRLVVLNSKIVSAIKEYLKVRIKYSEYLFVSNKGNRLDRTVINKMFNKYSENITPHTLRHFYCTNALENGYGVHEVAQQAGHSNIHTTLRYTNPNLEKMKQKADML